MIIDQIYKIVSCFSLYQVWGCDKGSWTDGNNNKQINQIQLDKTKLNIRCIQKLKSRTEDEMILSTETSDTVDTAEQGEYWYPVLCRGITS